MRILNPHKIDAIYLVKIQVGKIVRLSHQLLEFCRDLFIQ